jgi:hypothetical protein
MEKSVERAVDWAGRPAIGTVARLVHPELTLQSECFLLAEREKEVQGGSVRWRGSASGLVHGDSVGSTRRAAEAAAGEQRQPGRLPELVEGVATGGGGLPKK